MKTVSTFLLLTSLLTSYAPAAKQFRRAPRQPVVVAGALYEIPTVDFCDLARHPRSYFDKTVRVTATLQLAVEGAYLLDDRCPPSHDELIGVGFLSTDKRQRDAINRNVNKIRSGLYGNGRSQVTVVGILHNSSSGAGGMARYQYRFDIMRFEDVRASPGRTIINYDGTLQAGLTYRATVRGDKVFDLVLLPPLKILIHQSAGIDWMNLDEFPALSQLRSNARERVIVFRVESDKTTYMNARRWSRMLVCKIIAVE